eukprot:TRINITY_DN12600_c1_g1_i3.p2 TRINITY_DN12600_c1_g1~~TRINITY_DN12600_c1_g1_i3.p2  ORF type:complete len:145 (+),score=4.28 TRINITY_DN12600_c1_g1_i3:2-436(+)
MAETSRTLFEREYEIVGDTIQSGSYGDVWPCRSRSQEQLRLAVKITSFQRTKESFSNNRDRAEEVFERELAMLTRYHNDEHFSKAYNWYWARGQGDDLYIVMKFYSCDLYTVGAAQHHNHISMPRLLSFAWVALECPFPIPIPV